jgi:large subunit ribosomal protein L6
MSRIGQKPIPIPPGVQVQWIDGRVEVQGPKGKLSLQPHALVRVELDAQHRLLRVVRRDESRLARSVHGLARSLLANMIQGVTQGFEKRLEIVGVGYSASLKGKLLQLNVGFAHPVFLEPPPGVTVEVPDATHIVVRGPDKQLVGEFAAQIRRVRPPEPYKGKGIRYQGEQVRRKEGKVYTGR